MGRRGFQTPKLHSAQLLHPMVDGFLCVRRFFHLQLCKGEPLVVYWFAGSGDLGSRVVD